MRRCDVLESSDSQKGLGQIGTNRNRSLETSIPHQKVTTYSDSRTRGIEDGSGVRLCRINVNQVGCIIIPESLSLQQLFLDKARSLEVSDAGPLVSAVNPSRCVWNELSLPQHIRTVLKVSRSCCTCERPGLLFLAASLYSLLYVFLFLRGSRHVYGINIFIRVCHTRW